MTDWWEDSITRAIQEVRLGLEERPGLDTVLEGKLRIIVVEAACRLASPECRQSEDLGLRESGVAD